MIIFLVITSITISIKVSAEEKQNFGGFSVEGIPNPRQIDKNSGYFYLSEKPGSKDSIKIKLINNSNKDKLLIIKVVDANTNSNGIVDYSGTLKNNTSLKIPLTSIVKSTQKEVSISKNSSKEITLDINMPAHNVQGVILGGVVVSEKIDDKEKNQNIVSNDYCYTIGIVLTNEDKVNLFKNVSVTLENVIPNLASGKKVVQANILNPNPYIFSKAQVKGAVYSEDGTKKIKENSMDNVSIAPYSCLPFQIDWGKEDLKPGKYLFKGTVKTAENTWNFERKFDIAGDKAKEINKQSVFKVILPNWFKYSSVFLIILIILGTIYIYRRKYNTKNNRSEK
ncbi:DUF3324 domain-containing protein [Enterococcus hirae]|nr:DUF916 and DUF3324 domain-containing protein [Enterococcus hirae]EMF0097312.1 DUF916 and DUF3324 domain-containing protein [Enterococcus hirae]EMF0139682.1 DUF916 and DUF3324 domain-containing protein [Enterococcus hirae]EMF0147532.1 DUF916 and DUF3324 domain-containing protein [Enterococcus hirae]EMF0152740.1 DUF916 and DUF3324 domain-containing protein [Enterococcus hirae]EMF0187984.1 DUF916 and DUF3324 domain-containing protein [Enterococcus hirae]